jgi:diguanylate cyclase (GGDEF)-like protein
MGGSIQKAMRIGRGGTSLAARLLVVAAVPLAFMAHLAWSDIVEARATVEVADQFTELVALQRDVVGVMEPAYVEKLAQVGLGSIDSLGVDRALVASFVGIDYEAIYRQNQPDLDRAVADLAIRHGSLRLENGQTLGSALGTFQAELARQRSRTDAKVPDTGPAAAMFDRLDTTLDEALDVAREQWKVERLPAELLRFDAQTTALDWVLRSARDKGQTIMDAATRPGEHRRPIMESSAGHRQAIDQFLGLLGPLEADAFRSVVTDVEVPIDQIPDKTTDLTALDPVWIRTASALVLQSTEYQQWLGDWADSYYASMAGDAERLAGDARDSLDDLNLSVASIGLAVLLVVVLVSRSVLGPLSMLGRRASQISAGLVGLEPLPVFGPRSLRRLTRTVNSMQQTLQLMDRQMAALAAGRLDDPVLAEVAPGPLGQAITSSVSRLADVTAQLHDSEARASAVLSHAAVAIWTVDDRGVVQSANSAAALVLAMPEADQVGEPLHRLVPVLRGECEVVRRDGSRLWLDVDHSEVTVRDGTPGERPERLVTVIAEDITERKEFERRLAHQARHDALTGILNRFAVLERLGDLAERNADAAVLFLDVDGFKSVNDTQGHGVGDRVLIEIARRLQDEVRHGSIVARLGGDEFVVVIEDARSTDDLVRLGRRLIERLEQPYHLDQALFALSASVGVATMVPGDDPLDVIHRADAAVYQAKELGRGRVEVFNEATQARIEQRAELELSLREAVANDELDIVLQPIHDLVRNEVCGAEALVRWNRVGHGNVPPSEFIPVAESSALIGDLTRFVLRRACEAAARWRQVDPTCRLRVSVNLSGRHLIDGDLIADLTSVLDATGADPRMLELELTETQLLADLAPAAEVLSTVRSMGITIAVDDFGTGFSSMSYLRTLPVDAIKIDRSFVAGAGGQGFDSTAIDAMVNFGRVLGIEVVAEGVETALQLVHVRDRGCTRAQGFWLAKPMPVATFEAQQGLASAARVDA